MSSTLPFIFSLGTRCPRGELRFVFMGCFFFRTHDKFLLEREEQIFHVAMFWWPEGSFSLRFLVQTWSLKITISICSLFWSEG